MLMMDAPLHERQRTAHHQHCACTLTVQQWPSLWRDMLLIFALWLLPAAIWLTRHYQVAPAPLARSLWRA